MFLSETGSKIEYTTTLTILIYKYFLEKIVIKVIIYYPLKIWYKKIDDWPSFLYFRQSPIAQKY